MGYETDPGPALLRTVSVLYLKSARKAKKRTTMPTSPNKGLMIPRNSDTDTAAAAAIVCDCR